MSQKDGKRTFLKSLRIRDFASISEGNIEFVPSGITIICGENNTGKTNVIRALKTFWGLIPFSEKRIRFMCGRACLDLVMSSEKGVTSVAIERTRSGQKTKISSDGHSSVVLEGARASRKEIEEVLPPVSFIDPFDTPDFLVSGRGDTVYKKLISLFGLDIVVPVMSKVKHLLRSTDAELARTEEALSREESLKEEAVGLLEDAVDIEETNGFISRGIRSETDLIKTVSKIKECLNVFRDGVSLYVGSSELAEEEKRDEGVHEILSSVLSKVTQHVVLNLKIEEREVFMRGQQLEESRSLLENLYSKIEALKQTVCEYYDVIGEERLCPLCNRRIEDV